MLIWILDDSQVDVLARVVAATDVSQWPMGHFFVAKATADAASGLRQNLLAMPAFQSFDVMMGSPAADVLYVHLRQASGTTKNLAERQAIAWGLTERQDAVFVVIDKLATVEALAELGLGRVAHAFDLWLALLDGGLVTADQFGPLCQATQKSDQRARIPRRCLVRLP